MFYGHFQTIYKRWQCLKRPAMPLSIIMILTIIYLAKSGMQAFGKWAVITLVIICVMLLFTILSSLKSMDFTNILPIMGHDFKVIFKTSITQFFLPFGETVYFLGLAGSLRKKDNPYKTYFVGILIASFLTLLIIVCNIELLGPAMVSTVTYPSYSAAKIINIGDFFAKIESIITTNYIFAGIAKVNFCIIVLTKGIAQIAGIKDYKILLAPVGLLVLTLSFINYKNAEQVFSFIKIYPIYMIPVYAHYPRHCLGSRRNKKRIKINPTIPHPNCRINSFRL